MGRQSFRQRKTDGTIDDGTGGGGVFSTGMTDSEKTFLLSNTTVWALHSCPIFGSEFGQGETNGTYNDSHYYVDWWPFVAPRSGDIASISLNIPTAVTTNSDVVIGIYDSENGYIKDLLGCAQFDNSIFASTGNKEQTSMITNYGGSSTTITLVEGNKYFYSLKRDNSSNNTLFYKTLGSAYGFKGGRGSIGNHGSTGYQAFHVHNTDLPASESNAAWVNSMTHKRLRCWIKM